jgi:hypothetical protein
MIIICPYCSVDLNRPLNDGISYCSHCNHAITANIKTKILSLFKYIKKSNNLNIDKIKFETRSEIDEILFAYSFAIDHNYSNDEFSKMLDKFFDS